MKANELRKLSERWGVDLQGFENLAISLKIVDGSGCRKEAKKISKALERRGYRLKGAGFQESNIAIYAMDDGTYGFSDKVMPNLTDFKYSNMKDICGEQIIDKNLFYGFICGFAFGAFLMLILWWIL